MTPALILAALTAGASPIPVINPEPACAPTLAAMTAQLSEHYGERPIGLGREVSGGAALLFVSAERGTWTMVYFEDPKTMTCIVGAGTGWRAFPSGEGI